MSHSKMILQTDIKICQPLEQFTLFPQLPPEIRNKIWSLAAMVPRDIKLYLHFSTRRSSRIEGQSIAPAIMHTSKESRSAGELHYTQCVEIALKDAELHLGDAPPDVITDGYQNIVWVNFEADRFVLSGRAYYIDLVFLRRSPLHFYNFQKCYVQKIKNLVVPARGSTTLKDRVASWIDNLMSLLRMDSMKQLVVMGKGASYHHLDLLDYRVQVRQEKDDIEKLGSKYLSSKGLSVKFSFHRLLPGEARLPALAGGYWWDEAQQGRRRFFTS